MVMGMFSKGVLREHSSTLILVMRSLDVLAIVVAAAVAYRFTVGEWPIRETYQVGIALGLVCAFVSFDSFALYRAWRGISTMIELRALTAAWVAAFVALVCLLAVTGGLERISLGWLLTWTASGWGVLVIFRVVLRFVLRWIRTEGYNQRRVVIVGMSSRGMQIAQRIRRSTWTGLQVVGFFDERCPARTGASDKLPCLGHPQDLARYVAENQIDQVWVVYPLKAEERVKEVLHLLRHSTVDVRYVLDIFGFDLCNHSINEVAGIPILNLSASPLRGMNAFLKAAEDRVLALLILTIISPLMLAIAVGVKLSSPGPVFYRQERLSWNNRPFMMLKFRSMPVAAESDSGPVWAKAGENRATKFGAFLRRTSLDELPQFINVLKGDMSIVGPRPERPVFVEQFKDEIPSYMKKHLVKAGITGWAQIHGWRGDTDLAKRIEYDLYYIEHWSLWLDLRIVFMTIFKGFIHKNAY
jgi:putative colanic acid biosynthesis UDP-glucose lipid carrier transferase